MIVTHVSGRRFARWTEVDVDLPETGIVLVTGNNGHGKSTIVEAVAQGVWGQSLRGRFGWRTDEKSGVEVTFKGGHVRRSVSKSKHVLKWHASDQGAAEYTTRTKSQEALESHVGSFGVWRHACTFHTRDAARFSGATDAERKRLLEEVLELDRVEAAYRRARDEVKAAQTVLREAEHTMALRTTEATGLRNTRAAMAGELEPVPDLDELREEARKLKAEQDKLAVEVETTQAALRKMCTARDSINGEVHALRQRLKKLAGLPDTCPTCEQPVDADGKHSNLSEIEAQIDAAAGEAAAAGEKISQLDELLADLARTQTDLREAYQDNVRQGREGVAAQQRNETRAAKLATIDTEIAAADQATATATATAADAAVKVRELEAAAQVLSYQGARAALLSAAVASLESMANVWLQRMGLDGLTVRLSSQSETKAGKVSDKISFDVDGAGGGLGYLAASTGEQRRIDIALLLALGELAADSRGMSPASTLFVDELFDGLDDDGLECAVEMLREIAAQRCVVVISHHAGLVTRLAPSVHLVAQDGRLSGKGT